MVLNNRQNEKFAFRERIFPYGSNSLTCNLFMLTGPKYFLGVETICVSFVVWLRDIRARFAGEDVIL